MGAGKWVAALIFTAVSLLAVAYLVGEAPPDVRGMDLSSPLFWATLTALAVADSVNPCMISVMILMVATLAALGLDKRDLVVRAAIFTLTIFVTYLLLGILIFYGYSYIYALSVAVGGFKVLKAALVAVLVIGGLINIRDAIVGGRPTLSIPESAKPRIRALMTYVSVVATVLLATFVTIVELPCTGIFYLGLIAYLHSLSDSVLTVLPVLLYYNFLFVLPEIIIALFVWKGVNPDVLREWYARHRRTMRALEGAVMILLGLIVYLFVKVG